MNILICEYYAASGGAGMNKSAEAVYVLHAQILKSLAQPKRLMILDHLHAGEKSVGELVELLGFPQSNVSQHLAALRAGDIVTTRREGNTVYYSLVDPRIVRACDIFHEVLADRMKTNRAFASQFPRLRPLRSAAAPPTRRAARS
jgi:DNA-binding transcriptional ArsR family regulator